MQVNLSHAWFLNDRLYGNSGAQREERVDSPLEAVEEVVRALRELADMAQSGALAPV